ncbi:MAG: MCE family protein [Rhodococcus sp. (in: high G+C Gram-positive bacteria)]|uniref:MCE family protein n=1 Tax=Rhodococcus sp. TaxID=1831 RepID=UPI003BAFAC4E
MISIRRLSACAALTLGVAVTTTGCRFDGINSIPLPGNAIDGDTYQVTVELADIQNLVGNSPVKADNVVVGNISRIGGRDWIARLTLDLRDDAQIPANVSAKLAQTSVLGSQYLELSVPAGEEPTGTLKDGAVIPIARTSQYASTEEVLSALSLVLNGSGLQQIRTVTSELVRVLDGREHNLHELFGNLETLMGGLDRQRGDIVRAIDGLDRLAAELGAQNDTLDRGIDTIPPGMQVLNDQQQQLTTMLTSVGEFGEIATRVLDSGREDLHANLTALQPTLSQLASVGDSIPEALEIAGTIPFPIETADRALRGDYMNLFLTLDLSAETVGGKVLGSIPVSELAGLNPARQSANPLLAPTQRPTGTPPTTTPATGAPQPQGGQR